MQQFVSTMQQEVHLINLRVGQSQLDIQECLKHHHPSSSSSDDEADAPMDETAYLFFCVCLVFIHFETFYNLLNIVSILYWQSSG
jgi:hypothetical protein